MHVFIPRLEITDKECVPYFKSIISSFLNMVHSIFVEIEIKILDFFL